MCSVTSWKIENLVNGKYYWSVQAIDNSFAPSQFAIVDSFQIAGANLPPELFQFDQKVVLNKASSFSLQLLKNSFLDAENDTLLSVRIDSLPQNGILMIEGLPVLPGQIIDVNDYEKLQYICDVFQNDRIYLCPNSSGGCGLASSKVNLQVFLFDPVITWSPNDVSGFSAGDYDADGDLDIASAKKVYENTGGTFLDIGINLTDSGEVKWGDMDSDNDLDLIIGENYYENTGENQFVLKQVFEPALLGGTAIISDFNADNYPDYFYNGVEAETGQYISRIYQNQGNGVLNESDGSLLGFRSGSIAAGDFDNDGDMDVAICGIYNTGNQRKTIIYRNDKGQFTDIDAGLPGVNVGSLEWSDFDCDGDLDLLLCGSQGSVWDMITRIYRNDGGLFTDCEAGQGLPRVLRGFARWVDIDADGLPDIITGGFIDGALTRKIQLFKNIDGTSFVEIANTGFPELAYTTVNSGDFDNDGYSDLLFSGITKMQDTVAFLYHNCLGKEASEINVPPTQTTGLLAAFQEENVLLSWAPASDQKTSSPALTYNLIIGTTPGGTETKAPLSDVTTGYRKIVDRGNAGQNTFYKISGLKYGKYYWSVQAIDNGYLGGPFAPMKSFEIAENSKVFSKGWTWFSLNISDADMSVTHVLGHLKPVQGDYIKNQTTSSTYYDGSGWFGDLTMIDPREMYKIKLATADTLKFEGIPVDPESTPVTINKGWTWIGYIPQLAQTVTDALTTILPATNDYIKNKAESSTYYDDFGWFGYLTELEPLEGYMIRSGDGGMLTYASGVPLNVMNVKSVKNGRSGENGPVTGHSSLVTLTDPVTRHMSLPSRMRGSLITNSDSVTLHASRFTFQSLVTSYEFSMQLTAKLEDQELVKGNPEMVLVAYRGEEVRGYLSPVFFPPSGDWVFDGLIYGNQSDGEEFSFKLVFNGGEIGIENIGKFVVDGRIGDALNPLILKIIEGKDAEVWDATVFPNPSAGALNVVVNSGSSSSIGVKIMDMQGRVVLTKTFDQIMAGKQNLVIETGSVAAGSYTVAIYQDNRSTTKQIIVK